MQGSEPECSYFDQILCIRVWWTAKSKLCVIYAFNMPQLCGLVTDNVRYRIAHSSVCNRLQINVIYVTSRLVTFACWKTHVTNLWNNGAVISISARLEAFHITVVEGKTFCNVFLTFKISVIQVWLRQQKGSRNFIEILGISSVDSYENFLFKFWNRDHQRWRDKRNQNVDTWNPQYGFKLTTARRQMPQLSSHRRQLKSFLSKTFPTFMVTSKLLNFVWR